MARINLKPSLWEHDAVGEVSPHARLVFIGILTLADRRGVLRGPSPGDRIQLEVFPHDETTNGMVESWLNELQVAGLIARDQDGHAIKVSDWRAFVGRPGRPTLPSHIRRAVLARDGRLCGICGGLVAEAETVHIDHVYPWSLGGGDDLENLQVSHPDCNIRKGDRA